MKIKLSEGSTVLNAYHQEHSKKACKAIMEMRKHPFTLEQAKAQTKRINEGMKRSGKQAKTMKISNYKRLIQVLPFMEQAFEVKRSQWTNLVSEEILNQIFGENVEQKTAVISDQNNPSIKPIDQTVMISRFELFHKYQNLELFIVKVLMWGYPTKGRGKNIENLLNDSNITKLKNALGQFETKETVTISEIKDILKIDYQYDYNSFCQEYLKLTKDFFKRHPEVDYTDLNMVNFYTNIIVGELFLKIKTKYDSDDGTKNIE